MKMHILTIGKPKLPYAKLGWDEYLQRLRRSSDVRVTHLSDKYAYDSTKILNSSQDSYRVALVIDSKQLTSYELAAFIKDKEFSGREITWIIGGPDGLPADVLNACDYTLSFSKLTFPHDLAMVILLEALYRAMSITNGHPYHH